jgi:hypothetical protein
MSGKQQAALKGSRRARFGELIRLRGALPGKAGQARPCDVYPRMAGKTARGTTMRRTYLGWSAGVFLALALAGCVSPEELRAQDEAACAGYGFAPGTPDFAGCLQRQALARSYQSSPQVGFGLGLGFGRF